MSLRKILTLSTASVLIIAAIGIACSIASTPPTNRHVHDPGVRAGTPGAGGPIAALNANELAAFVEGQKRFGEVETVPNGLGPRFNAESCAQCHAFPKVGGSSPVLNPQPALATDQGGKNVVPSFITASGPVREARFLKTASGAADGSVHDLFVISGRADAPAGCAIVQPDFPTALKQRNVIFRIPTPVFGDGFIESITDATILANQTVDATPKSQMGIHGRVNRIAGIVNLSGNDTTITRFGWKAQNKSAQIFAGEAYNVEQGVTNELFPNEREDNPACATNSLPEDHTNFDQTTATAVPSDVVMFATFARFLAPPQPAPLTTASQTRGKVLFTDVGCGLCHTPTLHTGKSNISGVTNQDANLFSDLLVHKMGTKLADGVTQGNAAGNEFRSAPLWGVGQRLFFLHDGRTSDLLVAIQDHRSEGSEANKVIEKFNKLNDADEQAILDYLRTL
jgi:CxxC motif-containing protein (DUF1111 family)